LASWSHAHATAAPQVSPARRRVRARSRARARGGVLWIAVSAVLLAGVVFVNVAVLRLNLSLDDQTRERAKLHAENAVLQSELSSALASPRVQAQARRELGVVPADPSSIGFVDLTR